MGAQDSKVDLVEKMTPGEIEKRFGKIPAEYINLPIGVAIFTLDCDGMLCIDGANYMAEEITGLHIPDILGKKFEELYPDALRTGLLDTLLESVHEKVSREMIGYAPVVGSDRKVFKIKSFPMPNGRLGVIFNDVTNEIALQVKAEDLENELERCMTSRSEIIDAVPMGICILRPEAKGFVLISMNPEAERLLGINSNDATGRNHDVIWPGSDKQGLTEIIRQVSITGITYEIESLHYKNSHKQGYFHLRVFPAEGSLVGIVFQDITHKVKLEDELKKRNIFLENVLDSANLWINLIDPEGNITFWNKSAEEISGYSAGHVIGDKKIWDLLYPDPEYRDKIFSKMMDILSGNSVQDFETEIQSENGDKKKIIWYSTNLKDRDGKLLGSLTVGRHGSMKK
ncbi:MAG: PAS domain-containing protein [Chloroflexi bacterium]|nr:PAS domain-containing protein [Chloroflexota bacterium]